MTEAELKAIRLKEAALTAVWDNIDLADSFISKAEEAASGKGDIPLRWCLFIAANGLWSAADIFNEILARDDERLSREGSKDSRSWFLEHELLVHYIRNGQVHSSQPIGVESSMALTLIESKFLWVGEFDSDDLQQFPIDEVLSRLAKVAEVVRQHIGERTPGEVP